jgi:hypothetical protein
MVTTVKVKTNLQLCHQAVCRQAVYCQAGCCSEVFRGAGGDAPSAALYAGDRARQGVYRQGGCFQCAAKAGGKEAEHGILRGGFRGSFPAFGVP